MKKISISKIAQVATFLLVISLVVAPVAFAQFRPPSAGFIMKIINIALTVAGLVAVLFLIIGGFRYITSAGNEETAESAKKIIINAIIGIVIIILSFVIVRVISEALVNNNV
jgi:TRAP-type C4-dicarboxylate transport system permease small subunit